MAKFPALSSTVTDGQVGGFNVLNGTQGQGTAIFRACCHNLLLLLNHGLLRQVGKGLLIFACLWPSSTG